MKKLLLTIVLVKSLPVPAEQFELDEIQALAESSLEIGGFVQPPVLRRDGENYAIVSGHKQIAAAHLARLIDPRNGEAIPAMLIEAEIEEAAIAQIAPTPAPEPKSAPTPAPKSVLEIIPAPSWVTNCLKDHRSLAVLKMICNERGIIPTGDKRKKSTWANALAA